MKQQEKITVRKTGKKTDESRRKARELTLQMLFQTEIGKQSVADIKNDFLVVQEAGEKSKLFAYKLLKGTLEHLNIIDPLLGSVIEKWNLDRLSSVDRNILRMSCYEFLYCEDIPANVTINEAIELAKKYGTTESGGFVNGILDQIKSKISKDKSGSISDIPIVISST